MGNGDGVFHLGQRLDYTPRVIGDEDCQISFRHALEHNAVQQPVPEALQPQRDTFAYAQIKRDHVPKHRRNLAACRRTSADYPTGAKQYVGLFSLQDTGQRPLFPKRPENRVLCGPGRFDPTDPGMIRQLQ
ncbi:hypothetical protein D3C76_920840 [compost metagenome]